MTKLMTCVAAACVVGFAFAACPPQNPKRIAEIAEWLHEKPGLGIAPISDRAVWERLAEAAGAKGVIAKAARIMKEPVATTPDELYLEFTKTGNRTHYERANGRLNGNLTTLVFAEAFENKGRFLEKIAAYLEAECAQRSWSLPAHDGKLTSFNGKPHIDLGSGMKACLLAHLLAILGDRIPAELRAKVVGEIDRRIFRPYLETARHGVKKGSQHWWFNAEMNWNSVCNDTCVRAALLLVPDRRLRAEVVEAAERTAALALRGYGADG